MSFKFSQKFLIFIVIFFVCSITPASAAIQSGNNFLGLDFNQTYDLDDLLLQLYTIFYDTVYKAFNDGNNTELTPEQNSYLIKQEERLSKKSEVIINNSQDFLNYLIKEDYYYHPEEYDTPENLRETRGSDDKFVSDAKAMAKYITEANPKLNATEYKQCNYTELCENVNGTYDINHIIVQIKDTDGYIRYLSLISINVTTIHLKSGSMEIYESSDEFIATHTYNSEHNINILVSPSNSYPNNILRQVWSKQTKDLKNKQAWVGVGVIYIAATVSGVGFGIAVGSAMRWCDNCKYSAQKKLDLDLEDPPLEPYQINGLAHIPLLQHQEALIEKYKKVSAITCAECGRASALFGVGILMIGAGIGIAYLIQKNKINYDDDTDNLKLYEPPLN